MRGSATGGRQSSWTTGIAAACNSSAKAESPILTTRGGLRSSSAIGVVVKSSSKLSGRPPVGAGRVMTYRSLLAPGNSALALSALAPYLGEGG